MPEVPDQTGSPRSGSTRDHAAEPGGSSEPVGARGVSGPESKRVLRLAVLYHFMHPDDVISAHHLHELAVGFANRGWAVEAQPANRGCRDESRTYPLREAHDGVTYKRVWRPRFRQASFVGRLLNSAWMIAAWTGVALRRRDNRPDAVIVGIDPMFGVLTALPLKWLAPRMTVAHWCFDLHPEGAVASGMMGGDAVAVRWMQAILARAYAKCNLIADLGSCMRARLSAYGHRARPVTLPPWALSEPAQPLGVDPATRAELFGDAELGILYSGNFGEAHTYTDIVRLVRHLRDVPSIHFCFAVRGNQAETLRQAFGPDDTNVSFAGFAPLSELEKRLGAADVHIASLKSAWSGIAVPSKFMGSLAAGRPVVFAGAPDSAIADWIRTYGVGWVLERETVAAVATQLEGYANRKADIKDLWARCHRVYREDFSRDQVLDRWDAELRTSMSESRLASA